MFSYCRMPSDCMHRPHRKPSDIPQVIQHRAGVARVLRTLLKPVKAVAPHRSTSLPCRPAPASSQPTTTSSTAGAMTDPDVEQPDWELSKENFQPLRQGRKGAGLKDNTEELRSANLDAVKRYIARLRCPFFLE